MTSTLKIEIPKSKIVELAKQGRQQKEIARIFQVSGTTIYNRCKEYNINIKDYHHKINHDFFNIIDFVVF